MESRLVFFFEYALLNPTITSRCHLGESIVYDTVSNLSWAVDIRTHGIVTVIEKVLTDPWPPSVDRGRQVPEAAPEEDCVVSMCNSMLRNSTESSMCQECYSWEYGNFG